MNKVFLIGRLTKNPEARTTTNGIHVTTFTLAVNRKANREQTDFISIVTWRGLADNCMNYLVQGQQAAVSGEMQTRSYQGTDGKTRYITEVVADDVEFLAKPQTQQTASSTSPYAQQRPVQQQTTVVDPTMFNHYYNPQNPIQVSQDPVAQELQEVIVDDDLPF